MSWVKNRLGEKRLKGAYAYKDLMEASEEEISDAKVLNTFVEGEKVF